MVVVNAFEVIKIEEEKGLPGRETYAKVQEYVAACEGELARQRAAFAGRAAGWRRVHLRLMTPLSH